MEGTYKQTVAPTLRAVTLDEAKMQCNVTGTNDHDDYLDMLILHAAECVGLYTNRQVMEATYELSLDAFPGEIKIFKPPVSAISSITYIDTDGDEQTLSSSYYQTSLTTNDGPARIKSAYGYTWPSTRSGEYDAVTVTFVAGYDDVSDVPRPIKHAILFLVAHWFAQREPVIVGTISAELPMGVEMLLSLQDWGAYA